MSLTPAGTRQPSLPLDVPTPHQPRLSPSPFGSVQPGPVRYTVIPSPFDELLLTSDGESITGIYMTEQRYGPSVGADWVRDTGPFKKARAQLDAYFGWELRQFDLPLAPRGTDFQLRVWSALTTIPFGHTTSYGALATALGKPSSSRAVGMANGRNPASVVIPCHRVVGASGSLTGYGGGLPRKSRLLALEREQRP